MTSIESEDTDGFPRLRLTSEVRRIIMEIKRSLTTEKKYSGKKYNFLALRVKAFQALCRSGGIPEEIWARIFPAMLTGPANEYYTSTRFKERDTHLKEKWRHWDSNLKARTDSIIEGNIESWHLRKSWRRILINRWVIAWRNSSNSYDYSIQQSVTRAQRIQNYERYCWMLLKDLTKLNRQSKTTNRHSRKLLGI